jgi:hypothetical protein
MGLNTSYDNISEVLSLLQRYKQVTEDHTRSIPVWFELNGFSDIRGKDLQIIFCQKQHDFHIFGKTHFFNKAYNMLYL